jgi:exodeoxyribonuclease VII small subunit
MPKQTSSRDAAADTAASSPANFEAAINELEKLVARMESGELSLEDSLAAHKRGLELAQFCQGLLARAQQQVRVLEQDTLKALSEVAPGE